MRYLARFRHRYSPPTPPDRLVRALADRYRIDRELGEGGLATVYLAHDPHDTRGPPRAARKRPPVAAPPRVPAAARLGMRTG